jgi:hypothetical protein
MRLRFKISAYTPATMPMDRLAEYMRELANMLGDPAAVHFVRVDPGSTELVHDVDEPAYPQIEERIGRISRGDADISYMSAFRALNRKLKEDDADGELRLDDHSGGAKLLEFPGVRFPEPDLIEPVKQLGTIDGQLISIGGRDATVPARVQDGDLIYRCNTTRAVARELGQHLFGPQMRFVGAGTWTRSEDGIWALKVFDIQSFEPLDEAPLQSVVRDLREIKGEWFGSDVWDELKDLREKEAR